MSWTYSAWPSQSTAAARLSMLRQHITEVSDQVGKERGADGFNESSNANQQYLNTLFARLDRLEAAAGSTNGGVSAARLGSRRDVG